MSNVTHAIDLRLPRGAVTYMNVSSVVGAAVTTAVLGGAALAFLPNPWSTRVAVVLAAFCIITALTDCVVLNKREQRFFVLHATPDVVQIHRGRLLETDVTLQRSAVVSVDLATGPLLRRLGLAKVKFNGIGRVPEIPPLSRDDARALQKLFDTSPPDLRRG